jgi:hypothetical protein
MADNVTVAARFAVKLLNRFDGFDAFKSIIDDRIAIIFFRKSFGVFGKKFYLFFITLFLLICRK